MEREVSSAVQLSVMIIAVSVLISLVMYTIILGNEFKTSVYEGGSTLVTELNSSGLRSLADRNGQLMAKASIYSILCREHDYVSELHYTKLNSLGLIESTERLKPDKQGLWGGKYVYPEDVLSSSLSGKAKVVVSSTSTSGYRVEITDVRGE